jgi:hypothetical protein
LNPSPSAKRATLGLHPEEYPGGYDTLKPSYLCTFFQKYHVIREGENWQGVPCQGKLLCTFLVPFQYPTEII